MKNTTIKPAVPQFQIPDWLRPHVAEVRTWGPVEGENTLCWVDGCTRTPHLHGICRRHYQRAEQRWKRPRNRKTARTDREGGLTQQEFEDSLDRLAAADRAEEER